MRAVQCVKAMNAAKEPNAKKKLDAAMKAMKAATVADAPRVAMKTMKAKDAPRMKPRGAMKTMEARKAMKAQQPRVVTTPPKTNRTEDYFNFFHFFHLSYSCKKDSKSKKRYFVRNRKIFICRITIEEGN